MRIVLPEHVQFSLWQATSRRSQLKRLHDGITLLSDPLEGRGLFPQSSIPPPTSFLLERFPPLLLLRTTILVALLDPEPDLPQGQLINELVEQRFKCRYEGPEELLVVAFVAGEEESGMTRSSES